MTWVTGGRILRRSLAWRAGRRCSSLSPNYPLPQSHPTSGEASNIQARSTWPHSNKGFASLPLVWSSSVSEDDYGTPTYLSGSLWDQLLCPLVQSFTQNCYGRHNPRQAQSPFPQHCLFSGAHLRALRSQKPSWKADPLCPSSDSAYINPTSSYTSACPSLDTEG